MSPTQTAQTDTHIPHPLTASNDMPDYTTVHEPSHSHDRDTTAYTSHHGTMNSSMTQTTLAPSGSNGKFDRFESPAGAFPTSRSEGWEEAYERQQRERWKEKVDADLRGWRGGNGEPRSGYSKEAVPTNSYYGQPVTGTIGKHLPKEILRVERDWSDGEVCQFESSFPMELEGRISPQQWKAFIEPLNQHLFEAYSVRGAVVDNLIAIATWWTSLLWRTSHFERCLIAAERHIAETNKTVFNAAGLNVLSPRDLALQFLEIEWDNYTTRSPALLEEASWLSEDRAAMAPAMSRRPAVSSPAHGNLSLVDRTGCPAIPFGPSITTRYPAAAIPSI